MLYLGCFFSVVVLVLGNHGPRVLAEEPKTLRVLSYNIHHAEGVDGNLDLERIAAVIRSVKPDLVALQEVDQGTNRTDRVDQPETLSQLTAMSVIFGKNIDYEGGAYGNAVLSRFPMKLCKNLKLPSLLYENGIDDREQRGVLIVEVQTPAHGSVIFAATHLDSRRPDNERLESAKRINDYFTRCFPGRAAILAGDLNATPKSSVLQRFAELWHNATNGDYLTVPSKDPYRQIDFVLCRPANRWKIADVQVLQEPVASDHRPVLTVLQMKKTEGP